MRAGPLRTGAIVFLVAGALLAAVGLQFGLRTLSGLGAACFGAAAIFGGADIMARPGPAMMAAGAWACLAGVAGVAPKWTFVDASTTWWQRVPGRLVGILIVAIGIALIAAGRLVASEPGGPKGALGRIVEWLVAFLGG